MERAKNGVSIGIVSLVVIAIIVIMGVGAFLSTDTQFTESLFTPPVVTSNVSDVSTASNSTTTNMTLISTTEESSTSPSGLRLSLLVTPSNGSLGSPVIRVDEYNTLNIMNNASSVNDWTTSQSSLDYPCSTWPATPINFALFQGYYDFSNYTKASALALLDPNYAFACTTWIGNQSPPTFSFFPQSDLAAVVFTSNPPPDYNLSVSISLSVDGFWAGRNGTTLATFHNLTQGIYTVLGTDEWGKTLLVHFVTNGTVSPSGTSISTTGSLSSQTSSQATNSQENWNPAQVANLTLNSPEVQTYIKTAYSYDVIMRPIQYGPDVITVLMNVTGGQSVIGNWTTGYMVSYTGIRTLNATVLFMAPNTYDLIAVIITNLPNQTQSFTFASQQKQVIEVALSNSTVEKLIGTSPYYVDSVMAFPLANGTYAGDYFMQLYQLNGTKIIGVFVNGAETAVIDAYINTRITTICFGSSVPDTCFTSPWNATG